MCNRGPLFLATDLRVEDGPFSWWWSPIKPYTALISIDEFSFQKFSKSDVFHVRLITKNPNWNLIDNIDKYFSGLITFVIENLPDENITDYQLNAQKIVIFGKFVVSKSTKKFFLTKQLYLNNLFELKYKLKLQNLLTFSCLKADLDSVANLSMNNLKQFDLYESVTFEPKHLNFSAIDIRIDARIFKSLDYCNVELLQFYGNYKINASQSLLSRINYISDFLVGNNMFDKNQIQSLTFPKKLGIYVSDNFLSYYIDRANKLNLSLYIYSSCNDKQMIKYEKSCTSCNFNIFDFHEWNFIILTSPKIVVKYQYVESPICISNKKNTTIVYDSNELQIGMTRKTLNQINAIIKDTIFLVQNHKIIKKVCIKFYEFALLKAEKDFLTGKLREASINYNILYENNMPLSF